MSSSAGSGNFGGNGIGSLGGSGGRRRGGRRARRGRGGGAGTLRREDLGEVLRFQRELMERRLSTVRALDQASRLAVAGPPPLVRDIRSCSVGSPLRVKL